jgi:hypothetical protein
LERVTEESHQKHIKNWERLHIVLKLYSGKSYRRHVEGTWPRKRLITNLFQRTSYWNYILGNRTTQPQKYQDGREHFVSRVCLYYYERSHWSALLSTANNLLWDANSASWSEASFCAVDSPTAYLRILTLTALLTRPAVARKRQMSLYFKNNFLLFT